LQRAGTPHRNRSNYSNSRKQEAAASDSTSDSDSELYFCCRGHPSPIRDEKIRVTGHPY
jgi:hypothetical protein